LTKVPKPYIGEKKVSSTNGVEKLNIHMCRRLNLDP
jgi:hypothetical protein